MGRLVYVCVCVLKKKCIVAFSKYPTPSPGNLGGSWLFSPFLKLANQTLTNQGGRCPWSAWARLALPPPPQAGACLVVDQIVPKMGFSGLLAPSAPEVWAKCPSPFGHVPWGRSQIWVSWSACSCTPSPPPDDRSCLKCSLPPPPQSRQNFRNFFSEHLLGTEFS